MRESGDAGKGEPGFLICTLLSSFKKGRDAQHCLNADAEFSTGKLGALRFSMVYLG
jgi:hypothetical protein